MQPETQHHLTGRTGEKANAYRGKTDRLVFTMPPELKKKLKTHATKRGQTMGDFINQLLMKELRGK